MIGAMPLAESMALPWVGLRPFSRRGILNRGAIRRFAREQIERGRGAIIDATRDLVCAYKPNLAFYESQGDAGLEALKETLERIPEGIIRIGDAKRGDIGSTMEAYAAAWLGEGSPLAADAITASPYLGFGSLAPMVETARRHDAGVFVLALTSNPEGPQLQHAVCADGRTVAGTVLDEVRARNAGAPDLGSVGVVVGATIGQTDEDLDVGGYAADAVTELRELAASESADAPAAGDALRLLYRLVGGATR